MELKDWLLKQYTEEEIEDIVAHGLGGGFPGLTSYADTTDLYKQFHEEIWDIITTAAEGLGYRNALHFMSQWRPECSIMSQISFEQSLVWYAVETISREIECTHVFEKDS